MTSEPCFSIFGPVVVPGDRLCGPLYCMFFQKMHPSEHREFLCAAFITMVTDAKVTTVIFCAECADFYQDQNWEVSNSENSCLQNPQCWLRYQQSVQCRVK
jgi:hypothetical protein